METETEKTAAVESEAIAAEAPESSRQKKRALVIIVVLAAILVLAFVGYQAVSQSELVGLSEEAGYELSIDADANVPAPAEVLSCPIVNANDESTTIGDTLKGKLVVLSMWASWCDHCVNEVGAYQQLYDEYSDRVQFMMADITQGDPREAVLARNFIEEQAYTLPVYFDVNNDLVVLFGVRGLPTTVVMEPDGKVLMVRAGEITYDTMKATLDALLK